MKVSVALCTCQGERYLPDLLSSLLQQTRLPDEIVVCDDASTDRTTALLNEHATRHPGLFTIVVNTQRLGPAGNFAKALSLCSGTWVAFCDQDDVWMPDKLETLTGIAEQHPKAGFVFSDAWLILDDGLTTHRRLWSTIAFGRLHPRRFPSEPKEQLGYLLRRNAVTGAALLIQNDPLFRRLPPPAYWMHDEWYALLQVMQARAGIAYLRPLLYYRLHSRQTTGLPAGNRLIRLFQSLPVARENMEMETKKWTAAMEALAPSRASMPNAYALLKAKQDHLSARKAAYRSPRGARAGNILQSCLKGDYHRFALGWASAIKDLLTPRILDQEAERFTATTTS